MTHLLRPLADADVDDVVALSLRAWAPVFASLREVLGDVIFERLHPDWRAGQADAVRRACTGGDFEVVVAEVDGAPVGFVAFAADHASTTGVVDMLAVDPGSQGRGIGTALTEHAFHRLREAGMRVAVVETGGDPGHAPARRTYAKAGGTLLPIARFFKAL